MSYPEQERTPPFAQTLAGQPPDSAALVDLQHPLSRRRQRRSRVATFLRHVRRVAARRPFDARRLDGRPGAEDLGRLSEPLHRGSDRRSLAAAGRGPGDPSGPGFEMTPGQAKPLSIDGIQYLRGGAALMVVAHHARHYFPEADTWSTFGSRGVDIFFVISGFIMAHSTASFRADSDRASQAASFFWRRVVRVVPLYWLALLWTNRRAFAAGQWSGDDVKDFFFVPHFHPVYVDGIYPSLVPGWTINYEMFFYLVFALAMVFGNARYRVVSGVLLALVGLGLVDWSSAAARFYTANVLLEFLFGIGLYLLLARHRFRLGPTALLAISIAGFALLGIENSDAVRGFADGPFAAMIVGSVVLWAQGRKAAFLRALGDASYSIYLFHLATFSLSGALLRHAGVVTTTPGHIIVAIALQVVVAAAAGLLIHRFVEAPLLRAARHTRRRTAASISLT
jgi:exopolysaccharide production protein ExoZ